MNTAQRVESILEHVPAARDSDKVLFLTFMKLSGMAFSAEQERIFMEMPSLETIRRSRQLIQQEGRFPASEAVNEERYSKFKQMRENPHSITEQPGSAAFPAPKPQYVPLPWDES